MGYRVEITSSAQTQFKKLPASLQDRIAPHLTSLQNSPRPFGSKKLRDTDYYRLRIGDYRVVYAVNDGDRIVKILDIGHRRDVYR